MKYERIPEIVEAVPVHEIEYSHRVARDCDMPKWVQDGLHKGVLLFQYGKIVIRTPLGFCDHDGISYLVHSLDNDGWFFVLSSDFRRNFRECR